MAVIRVHQPHTRSWLSRRIEDALQIVGERIVILKMKNSLDNEGDERCPLCYDDIYTNTTTSLEPSSICRECYGTTYKNGINAAFFTSAIIGSPRTDETMENRTGQYEKTVSSIKLDWPAEIHKNDYVLRILSWTRDGNFFKPNDVSVYKVITSTTESYVKDGFNPTGIMNDRLGTSTAIQKQALDHPLYSIWLPSVNYPMYSSGVPFEYIPDEGQWSHAGQPTLTIDS